MQCEFCHEEGVRQSLSEVGAGYVIQATCGKCGSGWFAGTISKAAGDAMRAEQEQMEREQARLAATIPKDEQ